MIQLRWNDRVVNPPCITVDFSCAKYINLKGGTMAEVKVFKSIPEVHDSHDVHVTNERESTWSLVLKTITTLCLVALTVSALIIAFEMISYFSGGCK